MGGEPLLYYGFSELVEFVKQQGMMCHVITNGALVPKFIDTLKKVDLVEVSLDGREDGNDLNRGKGTYSLITAGIRSLRENHIPFRLSCVITKNNVEDIRHLVKYADPFHAYVGFTIPAEPKDQDCKNLFLSNDEVRDAYKHIRKLASAYKITLSKKSIDYILDYPQDYDVIIRKSPTEVSTCPYGQFIVFVDSSGNVYPCASLWERKDIYTPKNIFKEGLDEALKNAQTLMCLRCACAGSEEWNYMSSFRGLVHAVKFSISQ
jgi:MoaA/NifB/PqqE/SkfB family radical SAM enzyme